MPRSGERLAIAETGAISTNVTIQIDSGILHQCVTFLQSYVPRLPRFPRTARHLRSGPALWDFC